MENATTQSLSQKLLKVIKSIAIKVEPTNYNLLKKYDVAPDKYAYNWINVKNEKLNCTGVATLGKFGTVNLWLTKLDDKNSDKFDITVSKKAFNKEYVITSITDHWGNKIV